MNSHVKKNTGSAMIALLIVVGILVAGIAVAAFSYINASNTANAFEKKLEAQMENNKNVYAQYGQKVLEASQVPGMMTEDMVKVTTAALESRYGDGGAKAVFQMITEQNPQVSPQLYTKIQQIIEAGRDEFKTNQTIMLDVKRAYETELGTFWSGMWMRIAGYPKTDLSKIRIVSTESADRVFEAGKESAPIKLR